MKRICCLLIGFLLLLSACGTPEATLPATTIPTEETTVPQDSETQASTVSTEATVAPTQATVPTEPVTEPTFSPTEPTAPPITPISWVSTEDMVGYFNEVCLDAEFENAGDSSLLQKWTAPIYYAIHGEPTEADMDILARFCAELNSIYGFPGIFHAREDMPQLTNLNIHFCTEAEMKDILGENFVGCDGGVTFWYNELNEINNAVICCRTDLSQDVRNSVILEELYNGLGPVQDTWQRQESLIYAGYSTPQWMTNIDKVILQLLYHPDMTCGMDAQQCAQVIGKLYAP